MAGHLVGAAGQAMGLVQDHQVPARQQQAFEAVAVPGGDPGCRPPATLLEGLDRIQAADHLVVAKEGMVRLFPLAGLEVRPEDQVELLAEMEPHLLHPLGHEPLGGNHRGPPDQSPELQLPEDQPGLHGLAQAHLVGQQVAHPIASQGLGQGVDLVGQGKHGALQGSQHLLLGQDLADAGGGQLPDQGRGLGGAGLGGGQQILPEQPTRALLPGEPERCRSLAPEFFDRQHLPGLPQGAAEPPLPGLR